MTCKDCIHCEACERMISDTSKMFKVLLSEILKMNCDIKYDSTNILSGAEICQCFQDRARFVELPVKPGEKVFYFDTAGRIYESTVTQLVYGATGFLIDSDVMFNSNLIGERFFLTREAAEQALKEREENE